MNTPSLLGKGVYSIAEVARITGIDSRRIRRWVIGYEANGRTYPPVLHTPALTIDGSEIITFLQLMETLCVQSFFKEGVHLPVIRAIGANASQIYGTPYPFALHASMFLTDGKTIWTLSSAAIREIQDENISESVLYTDLRNGQTAMGYFLARYLRKIKYTHDIASQYWPLGEDRRVVLDPERAFGHPTIADSRIPTSVLFNLKRAGEPISAIARWYRIDEQSVRDAIEFEENPVQVVPEAA